jgi:hypothetical protein
MYGVPGIPDHSGSGASDILTDYVNALYGKAGFSTVINADSRYYHDGNGDIHCGTNEIRRFQVRPWWSCESE